MSVRVQSSFSLHEIVTINTRGIGDTKHGTGRRLVPISMQLSVETQIKELEQPCRDVYLHLEPHFLHNVVEELQVQRGILSSLIVVIE